MFDDMTREQLDLHARRIAGIEERIRRNVGSDAMLHRIATALTTIPGGGFVTAAATIAEMPEPGLISDRKAAALAGLAPYARDSGKKGKRGIAGGRNCLRTVPARRRSRLPSGTRFW